MSKVQEKITVTENGILEFGVVVDGIVHRNFVLRPAKLSDMYRAAESVSVPESLKTDQTAKIAYQVAFEDAQVLSQIVALGELDPVPSPVVLVGLIYPDDMDVLRGAAEDVKKKLRALRRSLPTCAPSQPDSSISASI